MVFNRLRREAQLTQDQQTTRMTPEAFEQFRKAAEAFGKRTNRSKATARKVLIAEGIYTKTGRLTKQQAVELRT